VHRPLPVAAGEARRLHATDQPQRVRSAEDDEARLATRRMHGASTRAGTTRAQVPREERQRRHGAIHQSGRPAGRRSQSRQVSAIPHVRDPEELELKRQAAELQRLRGLLGLLYILLLSHGVLHGIFRVHERRQDGAQSWIRACR
jgi:hypothetical protein